MTTEMTQAGGLEETAGGGEDDEASFVAELVADKQLTPRQISYLAALPLHNWQLWATASKIGVGKATLHRWHQLENFVQARDALMSHYLESIGATYERTVMELSRVAYADPRKAFHEGSDDLLPPSQMDDDTAAAVQSIEVTKTRRVAGDVEEERETKTIKFASKLDALQTLLKVNGKLVDKHELTGPNGEPLGVPVIQVVAYSDSKDDGAAG